MNTSKTNSTVDTVQHRFFMVRASAFEDQTHKKVNGTGHFCLAVMPSTKCPDTFRVGVSFKSPADKLDRHLGVRIAQGRLLSKRRGRNFTVKACDVESAFDVAYNQIFTKRRTVVRKGQKLARPFVPDWLHEAFCKARKITAVKQ